MVRKIKRTLPAEEITSMDDSRDEKRPDPSLQGLEDVDDLLAEMDADVVIDEPDEILLAKEAEEIIDLPDEESLRLFRTTPDTELGEDPELLAEIDRASLQGEYIIPITGRGPQWSEASHEPQPLGCPHPTQ